MRRFPSFGVTLAAKYRRALPVGEVPLLFLFSGTVLYGGHGEPGGVQIAPISWEREARFRLPVALWRELMDRYFPGSAWLRIDRGLFDRLCAYRAANALLDWTAVIAQLLPQEPASATRLQERGDRE